jgi:hypothetical protein
MNGNTSIEMATTTDNNIIDFHTSNIKRDYDARIYVGSNNHNINGGSDLAVYANTVLLSSITPYYTTLPTFTSNQIGCTLTGTINSGKLPVVGSTNVVPFNTAATVSTLTLSVGVWVICWSIIALTPSNCHLLAGVGNTIGTIIGKTSCATFANSIAGTSGSITTYIPSLQTITLFGIQQFNNAATIIPSDSYFTCSRIA